MNLRLLTILLLAGGISSVCASSFKEVPELGSIFDKNGVTGTFVLLDHEKDTMLVWNEARAKQRFIPASTFKVANTLIGLDVGAVKDVDEVLPYGGKPQPRKEWEEDMGLRKAIRISNVAIYQELARRIGLERMREGVKKLSYGNMEIGEVVDQFWLRGPLRISAVEELEFLDRLTSNKLPIKPEAIRAVKEITLLEKTDAYELHAKTGWAYNEKLGWWIGWVEREGKTCPFALNIELKDDADADKRITIGRECLKALGKL